MAKSYNFENMAVMVVDDNRHMRHLIQTILNSLGIRQVAQAEDGAAALKELQTFPADIVVCDWNMQPLDGIEFTRLIRTSEDSPNVYLPIIMLTGYTEMERVTEARDSGINEFLAKPVSAKKLYDRIRTIVETPRNFIRTEKYFGPDRRRKNDINYQGEERRKPAQ